ncbi:MAG: sulfite exporter TauE/SafE family protein [Deltaproteobacteria bacterium]|nr:sulfite exporter TauE/SafE family protein [Deltaproteobacteria bacterium]
MFDFAISGVQAPIFLLVFVGFTVGIVGGFIGVGGGYMVTPALIVFGFPGYMASGIDMTHIAGKGIVSTIRHRQLGNIDWTLALSMVAGTMLGVELGVRLLVYFKKAGLSTIVLLIASVVIMFGLFLYTQIETRRAHRKMEDMKRAGKALAREVQTSSLPKFFQNIPLAPIVRCRTARVIVSMWVIVFVGMVTGVLAGFLGVGGGFIRVPALVYLVGASTHIAVGTDLVEIVFSGGYGALRHSVEGHVDMIAVVFMISGAMIGAQVGSIATSFVRGPAIRYVLSYSLVLATCGAALRLAYVLTGMKVEVLALFAVMLTLGEMLFLCLFITSLVWFAVRARHGRWVPEWVEPLVVPADPEPAAPADLAAVGGAS